jgi:hypothetical protein
LVNEVQMRAAAVRTCRRRAEPARADSIQNVRTDRGLERFARSAQAILNHAAKSAAKDLFLRSN